MNVFEFLSELAARVVLPALLGGGAVWLIQWIKTGLRASGTAVYVIVALVAVILAIVSELAAGAIDGAALEPDRIWQTLTLIVLASQIHYARLKRENIL